MAKPISLWTTLTEPLIRQNPVTLQILGICSALAVTTSVVTAVTMSASLTIVIVSLLAIVVTAPFEESLVQRRVIRRAHFAAALALVLAGSMALIGAAFAAAWAIAFAYLWVLAKRTRDLQHKLDKVEGRIDRES